MSEASSPREVTRATDGSKMEYVAHATIGEVYRDALPWINLIIIVLGWFSISVEVFLRHSFGERYLNLLRVFLALTVMSLLTLVSQMVMFTQIGSGSVSSDAGFLGIYALYYLPQVFFLVSLVHLVHNWRRSSRGERWHSRSFGISHLRFLIGRRLGHGPFRMIVDDWLLYRLVEPLLVMLLALFLGQFAGGLGFYLFLAAGTLFIKNNYLYALERGRVLDMIDSEIEQDFMEAAFSGEDKRQTAGFTLVRAPRAVDRNNDGIPDFIQTARRRSTPDAGGEDAQQDFSDVLTDVFGQRQSTPPDPSPDRQNEAER